MHGGIGFQIINLYIYNAIITRLYRKVNVVFRIIVAFVSNHIVLDWNENGRIGPAATRSAAGGAGGVTRVEIFIREQQVQEVGVWLVLGVIRIRR